MTDTPKHTPGPWRVADDGSIGTILSIDGTVVAQAQQCRPRAHDPLHLERKANARLIAAAPELMEALKDAVHWLDRLHGDDSEIALDAKPVDRLLTRRGMRAILAKAEGDQP